MQAAWPRHVGHAEIVTWINRPIHNLNGAPRATASFSMRTEDARPSWHGDCIVPAMSDEKYVALLLWTICVLTFACGVVAITQHPEWFGA
jgi:hypothetical protein